MNLRIQSKIIGLCPFSYDHTYLILRKRFISRGLHKAARYIEVSFLKKSWIEISNNLQMRNNVLISKLDPFSIRQYAERLIPNS